MDGVDVKECYRLSLSTVQADNGMSWSEDHQISFITSTALHILEVAPNPSEISADMCLKRSLIKPPDDVPTKNSGIDANCLIYQLDRRNTYRLVLDVKLSPHLTDAKPLEPHFIKAEWSPATMYQDQRCMIATLTNMGCLKLYIPYCNSWIEIIDISQSWVDHCKSLWPTDSLQYSHSEVEKTFSVLQSRTSQIKITAITWGRLRNESDEGRFTHLATISHSGLLALWKINNLTDLGSPAKEYKPCLLKTCETNMYNAQVLYWLEQNKNQISVVIGDTNGLVKMITFYLKNSDYSIISSAILDIWNEKDSLRVSHISSFSPSKPKKEEIIVAVAKNSHFIVFLITQERVISSSFHQTGGLPITGLEVMEDETFIVSTLSGTLFKYSIDLSQSNKNSKISLKHKILTSNIVWNDLVCFGVAKSKNDHLWAFGTNLCKMYDHLVIRRPSRIIFCTVCGMNDPLQQLRDNLFSNTSSIRLYENWESIEIMRMNNIKLQKAQGTKIIEYPQDVDKVSFVGLQLELWRARTFVAQLLTTDVVIRNPEACAYVTLLEELILCQHACKFICTFMNSQQNFPIDNMYSQTITRLRFWLQAWFAQNRFVDVDKNCEIKSIDYVTLTSCSNSKTDMTFESKSSDQAENSVTTSRMKVSDSGENIIDNDSTSVGSFDDALSSDSNSSYSVAGNNVPKHVQLQHGRVPSNFLKLKLKSVHELVTNALSLSGTVDSFNKEVCSFCEQEIIMDIDWRFALCPANHRLPRCCRCLCVCIQIPYRSCPVCPAVACQNESCIKDTFCTFCDSLLLVDEKFKKPRFQPLSEHTNS